MSVIQELAGYFPALCPRGDRKHLIAVHAIGSETVMRLLPADTPKERCPDCGRGWAMLEKEV